MAHMLVLAAIGIVAVYLFNTLRAWRANHLAAKASGLPYIVIPILPYALPVRIFGPILFPPLQKLPGAWTESWLPHIYVMSPWYDGYSVYKQLGFDTYYLVAPGGLVLLTCSPEAVTEIQHRREDFQRPIEMFRAIGVYGPNLAMSEGEEWRVQRKLVMRAFGDKTHREVWHETIHQASEMVQRWYAGEKKQDRQAIQLNADTMKMSLHVISKAGFGQRMNWDSSGGEVAAKAGTTETQELQKAKHGMSYVEASRGLVNNVLLVIGVPSLLLRWSPFAALRKVHKYDEAFRAYILETISRGKKADKAHSSNDLLSSLVQDAKHGAGEGEQGLSDQALLGNSFLFIVGGHETTASSMMMAVMYLALKTDVQRRMQSDIDGIVGDRPPTAWSYDDDLPRLQEGMVGAVMNEELRLAAPIPSVVKLTKRPQQISFDGVETVVPADTMIALSALGAHRNPKYWPHGPPTDPRDPWSAKSNLDNDLEEFRPERWYASSAAEQTPNATDGLRQTVFRPQRGAFFPFAEGPRACIGRKFAQIEYAAVLAVIFQRYSIELDVRGWVSDEELVAMSREQRRSAWDKAALRVQDSFHGDMVLLITMHLRQGAELPIRLVPRGQERFSDM